MRRLQLHDGAAPGAARRRRRPGDEVITVSHSYIATANCDPLLRRRRRCSSTSSPARYNIDPRLIEAAITPRTRAILCVHQMGMPCDLAAHRGDRAQRHGLPVIEDAACAIGSEILWDGQWEKIGRAARRHRLLLVPSAQGHQHRRRRHAHDAATPSGTRKFRLLRQHAHERARHGAPRLEPGDLRVATRCVGYNYRMTDIQAAVGREQLKRLPEIVARAPRASPTRYTRAAGRHPRASDCPHEPHWARTQLAELLRAPAGGSSTSAP